MTLEQHEAFEALIPALTWLHSKKHDEKRTNGQWHRAWNAAAKLLTDNDPQYLIQFEHHVHNAIGLPADDCQCEVCRA